ncbi:ricin-type beta-trefoil lectin domain protein [Streptacidiphilus melanogenes]|uniref:ricin-type beta-trefoil lectin domain protein n=1 Tax=Streptacidiphilus melanogenes TaxID=411235 RepID=UPI0005A6BF9F|nr:ricin-type beta-trefoil lectin domain protein [Streptacidiphilus melanogenes]
MSLWTSLEPASTTVDAGNTATVRLRIRNTGDIVDEYRFTVVGDLAPYITVEPPTLRLYPGTTGTVELTVAPPRTPDAAAGPHPFAVQVTPTEHPEATTVPEGNITVTPFMEVRAELVPHTVKGRFRGRPKLAIDNLGNTTLTASVAGDDNGDQLGYEVVPANVQIEPGRAAFVNATLKPRQIIWIGHKQNRPYRLSVRRSGVNPLNVDGTYVQRGFLPRWLFTVLSLCLGLAIAFVALWMTNPPAFSSQATPLAAQVTPSQLPTPSLAPAPAPSQPAATPQGGGAPSTPVQVAPTGGGGGNGGGSGGNGGGGGAPHTAPAGGGSGVELVGRGSSRCITVTDGAAAGGKDGKPLELWDCSGAVWQKWTFVMDGLSDNRGTIQSLGLCMDVANANTADGTTVQLANCNGGPAQVWTLNTAQGGDLVNPLSNKCVDAAYQGTGNGTRLQIWDCNGQSNQKWVQDKP